MSQRVPTGIYPGTRWTILGPASVGHRRGQARARVKARCFCGREKLLFVESLQAGDTRGCTSASCRASFRAHSMAKEAVTELTVESTLDELVTEMRQAMVAAAQAVIARRVAAAASASKSCQVVDLAPDAGG